jgi:hypothetical protein
MQTRKSKQSIKDLEIGSILLENCTDSALFYMTVSHFEKYRKKKVEKENE